VNVNLSAQSLFRLLGGTSMIFMRYVITGGVYSRIRYSLRVQLGIWKRPCENGSKIRLICSSWQTFITRSTQTNAGFKSLEKRRRAVNALVRHQIAML
jgi:hypothetical protein